MSPRTGIRMPGLPLLALAGLALLARPSLHSPLQSVLCNASLSGEARPASVVSVLRTEAVGDGSNWRITTLLVFFPPHALTPRHVHGGALTAYVLSGRIRSQLDDGPVAELEQGDTFYEAVGTIHSFIENPGDEPASVLATIVHPPGAALTTMLSNDHPESEDRRSSSSRFSAARFWPKLTRSRPGQRGSPWSGNNGGRRSRERHIGIT